MTTEEIKARIASIAARSGDDESAHGAEDQLRADFLQYVSEVAPPSLAEKAKLVLSTSHIDFARWCA